MTTQYALLSAEDEAQLTADVQACLNRGWKLFGVPFVIASANSDEGYMLFQALIKLEKAPL